MNTIRSKVLVLITAAIIGTLLMTACAPVASLVPSRDPALSVQAKSASHAQPASAAVNKIDPLTFQQAMRKLWEDHITWTRVYIIAAIAGLPETSTSAQRLLQNQVDIGNAIKPFYGNQAGDQLTALLKQHILLAADLIAAAKAGDSAKVQLTSTQWYANANQIASFLNSANPKNWALSDMQNMMKMHLDLTLQEATARLTGDWNGDVAAYDQVHNEILSMADMLSAGIMKQFPDRFSHEKASPQQVAFTLAMNKLWEDHITWTRVYIMSVTSGLPDTNAAATRLLQNQVDIGNAIKPYYGEQAGNQLAALLRDHILIAADLLVAAKAGDSAKVQDASNRWNANADQIAAFLNAANPKNWPLSDMQTMMKNHLDLTLQEATARLKNDWPGDVAAYDLVHNEILQMSTMLSQGIIAQFPAQFK